MIKDIAGDIVGDMAVDVADDTSARGLIWAALRSCPCDNDESVEDGPERSDTNDDTCYSYVNLPKVARQRATEQQERKLQHQWQGLHHVVKVPGDDAIQLPLAIPATFYAGPPHVGRRVSIQPLLAEHRQESGEK
jgi:hypothetical protein